MVNMTIAPGIPCDICWKVAKPGSSEAVLRLHMPQGNATVYLHRSCFDEGAAQALDSNQRIDPEVSSADLYNRLPWECL